MRIRWTATKRRNPRNTTRGRVGARKLWNKNFSRSLTAGKRSPIQGGSQRGGARPHNANLTDREVVRVNNGLEQYLVSIDSVGTHVKLCLSVTRNNVHAKRQLAAALRLLREVPQQPRALAPLSAEQVHPRPNKRAVDAPQPSLQVQGLCRFVLLLRQPHKTRQTTRTDRNERFISLRAKTGPDACSVCKSIREMPRAGQRGTESMSCTEHPAKPSRDVHNRAITCDVWCMPQ